MKNNRYRLISIAALLFVAYGIIFVLNKSDIKALAYGLIEDGVIRTAVPSYSYIGNVEVNSDCSIASTVLNDISPLNEYLLANENVTQSNINREVINTLGENQIKKEQMTYGQKENETQNNNELNNLYEIKNTENMQKQSETQQNSGCEDEVNTVDAISRNVITGNVFLKENLVDYNFTHNNFYTVTSITSLTSQILRPAEFLEKDMTIAHDASTPQILIFHTHSQETFADSVDGDVSTSIVGVGDYLTQLLTEKYGYNVYHDTSVYDYVDGHLDRSKAYTYAEEGIARILEENPSIDVVIDLHRDGVAENTHLVTNIDGKDVAKIMFFNGLSYSNVNGDIGYLYNPFRDDNLAMSLQLHLLGEAYYPDFLRRIYVNAYRYCLHERGKSMLVEAGAQTNTVQEVKNAMEPFANILDKLLKGEKAYN